MSLPGGTVTSSIIWEALFPCCTSPARDLQSRPAPPFQTGLSELPYLIPLSASRCGNPDDLLLPYLLSADQVLLCQQRSISISLRLSNLLPFHHEFLLSLYELDGHFLFLFSFFENHFLSLTNHLMDQRELPFARLCQVSAFSFVNRLASHVVYLPTQKGRELGKA